MRLETAIPKRAAPSGFVLSFRFSYRTMPSCALFKLHSFTSLRFSSKERVLCKNA